MTDKFFSATKCDRCGGSLEGGRMAFYGRYRKIGGEKYLRVDFAKYINGEKRYLIKRYNPLKLG